MKVYWFLLAWSLLWMLMYRASWNVEQTVLGEKRMVLKKQHVFTSFFFIVLFIGLRGGILDSHAYIRHYNDLPSQFADIPLYFELHPNQEVFYFFSAIFKCIFSVPYHWWFFAITLISCFLIAYTLRKYSENYGASMYLFIATTMFTWLMNGLRQFLAVCALFALFDWFVQKKYIRLIIVILLLSMIHQSVLVMLPILFIVQAKPWGKTMWLVVLLSFATLVLTDAFTNILYEITMNTEYAEDWEYITNDTGTNILRAVVAAVPMLLSLIKRKEIAEGDTPKYIPICINFSVLTFGLYLFASVTSGIYIGRLPIYTEIFSLILFPWLISVPYKTERKLYTVLLFGFYAVYFIYQMQITWGGLPYYSPVFGEIV